jgi:hypothetical protein
MRLNLKGIFMTGFSGGGKDFAVCKAYTQIRVNLSRLSTLFFRKSQVGLQFFLT